MRVPTLFLSSLLFFISTRQRLKSTNKCTSGQKCVATMPRQKTPENRQQDVKEAAVLFIRKQILAPRRGTPRGASNNRLTHDHNKRPMAAFQKRYVEETPKVSVKRFPVFSSPGPQRECSKNRGNCAIKSVQIIFFSIRSTMCCKHS